MIDERLNIRNPYYKATDYYTRMNEDILKTISEWFSNVKTLSFRYDETIIEILNQNVLKYTLRIEKFKFELSDAKGELISESPYLNVILDLIDTGSGEEDEYGLNEGRLEFDFRPVESLQSKVVNDNVLELSSDDIDKMLKEIHG